MPCCQHGEDHTDLSEELDRFLSKHVQGEKSVLSLKALITRFRFHHSENFPFFSTVKIRTSSTVTSAEGRSGAVLVE